MALYPEFTCLAGNCPATCCSGWQIVVDPEAYTRFQALAEEELRQDILENMAGDGERYYFRNRKNGDCALLDADGLCRIQRHTSEEMLCNTCRKFPRLIAEICGGFWLSFAASCPVVADYILDGRVSWYAYRKEGTMKAVSGAEVMAAAGFQPAKTGIWAGSAGMAAGLSQETEAESVPYTLSGRLDAYTDIAMDALDVLIQCGGLPYLENSFDLYEQEEADGLCFRNYFTNGRQGWQKFREQYFLYRYPSRYLEYTQEDPAERLAQVQGELALMRVMLCSIYCRTGSLTRQDYSAVLHWVYRFCAHGEQMAGQNHRNFMKNASLFDALLFD